MQLGSQEWLIKRAKFPLYVGSMTSPLEVFMRYVQVDLLYSLSLILPIYECVENIYPMYCMMKEPLVIFSPAQRPQPLPPSGMG